MSGVPNAGLARRAPRVADLVPRRGAGRDRDDRGLGLALGRTPGRAARASRRRGSELRPREAVRAGREGDRPHLRSTSPARRGGDFSFAVARRPSPSSGGDGTLELPPLPPAAIDRFRSRRDLEAPWCASTAGRRDKRGLIFLAPFSPKGSPRPDGPLITDERGDLVWFKPVRRGTAVTDLKVQQLGGEPVITWWEGRFAVGWGYGTYKVFDGSLPPGRERSGPATA